MGRIDQGREARGERREPDGGSTELANVEWGELIILVAVVVFPLAISGRASAAELQWRRGRTPAASAVAESNLKFHRDSAVRLATADGALGDSYSGSGPGLSSPALSPGQATLRSIIVNREDASETVRSAQLPQPTGTTAPAGGAAAQGGTDLSPQSSPGRYGQPPEAPRGAATPDLGRQPGASRWSFRIRI